MPVTYCLAERRHRRHVRFVMPFNGFRFRFLLPVWLPFHHCFIAEFAGLYCFVESHTPLFCLSEALVSAIVSTAVTVSLASAAHGAGYRYFSWRLSLPLTPIDCWLPYVTAISGYFMFHIMTLPVYTISRFAAVTTRGQYSFFQHIAPPPSSGLPMVN